MLLQGQVPLQGMALGICIWRTCEVSQGRGQELGKRVICMPLGAKNINYFSDPDTFYRVVRGSEVFDDIVESGKIRTTGSPTYTGAKTASIENFNMNRPTAYPSFSKGNINLNYAQGDPQHYIIETKDKSVKPSTQVRHGKGTTHFPTDEFGQPQKSLDANKAKIWEHVGDGKYKRVSPRLEKIGRSLLTGLSEIGKGIALAPAMEFMSPPGLNIGASYSELTDEELKAREKLLREIQKRDEENLAKLSEYLKQ